MQGKGVKMLNLNKCEKEKIIRLLKQDGDTKANNLLIKRIEKSMQAIKPRSAKNKGLDWQKETCSVISEITGIEYEQKSDDCDIHSRESSLNGVDIILRGKAKKLFPYCIECKNAKNISLAEWARQAESNCDDLDNWLLFIKSPILPMKKVVVMPLSRFKEVAKKHIDLTKDTLLDF